MSPSRESTLLLAGMVIFSSLLLDQISTCAGLVLCETSTPPVPWKVIRQSVPWPSAKSGTHFTASCMGRLHRGVLPWPTDSGAR